MARWRMYIDDSATHGAVLDRNFQPIPPTPKGMMPVTSAGGILVAERAVSQIEEDVRNLRRKIRRELGLNYLPELHMRLMWGAQLPQKNNPYLLATEEQRFRWVKHGFDIIFKHGKLNQLKVAGVSLEIEDVQAVMSRYCQSPYTQLEHEYIRKNFPKATQSFYGIMLNPLVRMIMNLVAAGNHFCVDQKHTFSAFYDTSEASKGFTATEGMVILHHSRRFPSLTGLFESTTKDSDLMQLADFVAYRTFRTVLMRYRQENGLPHSSDDGMAKALRQRDLSDCGLSIPKGLKLESYHESLFAMLQVAYAAQAIRERYPETAEESLIPIQRYDVRPDRHGALTGFFPAIAPHVLQKWAKDNGKRPPL